MSDHKHGSMDIEVQEKTFGGFVKFTMWAVVVITVFLIFLGMVNG